uniref:peptidoglycan glycosyltransferase n=1 Tax=candidate division WOR-3 bacterium TaxID=2052148 RepID=A0A7V0Z3V1_UNCW3
MGKFLSLLSVIILMLALNFFIKPPDIKSLYPNFNSFNVTDRNGILLRMVVSKDYKTSLWMPLNKISPEIIKATIIKEDKRFFLHKGIDVIALCRAIKEQLVNRKIISGGSTLTMQVAKIVLNHKKRTVLNKIIEILYALKLELYLRKEKILEIYLNRAPYGYENYGVEAASQFYFEKSANQLSLSESCILSAIPKSPNFLNPLKNYEKIRWARNKILNELIANRLIDSTGYINAINEPIKIDKKKIIFRAPHFVDFILGQNIDFKSSNIGSTIDINLQENVEKMLFTSINTLKKYNVNQGAVVVMDTKTGDILAMVGSRDYFDEKEGQVNGCLSLRQPGSSIKPFLYLLALSSGIPMNYLMNDTITEFKLSNGTIYAPRNFGDKYHRLVRAREALGSSFNVTAVHILDKLGIENFYNFLIKLHFTSILKQPDFYGLSLSLGGVEVKLLELANAYRAIANKGVWTDYKFIKSSREKIGERVFSEEVAYIITDVLSDNSSRIKAFGDDSPLNLPFPCAVKTGTTKNFKDNWCVGFTEKYTVGVWVGNFDGSPMNGVSGISGAAPLFRDIMIELHRNKYPKTFESPKSLIQLKICAKTGLIPGKNCSVVEEFFVLGTEPKDTCNYCGVGTWLVPVHGDKSIKNIYILHPRNGDIFKLDPQIPYKNQAIAFKVHIDSTIESFSIKLNGNTLCKNTTTFLWQPKLGKYELEVIGNTRTGQKSEKITFTVF